MRMMTAIVHLFRESTYSHFTIKLLVPEDITYEEWKELEQAELVGFPGFKVFATQFA